MGAVGRSGDGGIVLAVAGLMLALFLVALDQTIVGTALPKIIADLEGFEKYAWVTTAYLLASTAQTTVALYLRVTGLGLIMPTATLAVQNSVEKRQLGVATSSTRFVCPLARREAAASGAGETG